MTNQDFITDISNILDNSVKLEPGIRELREEKNIPPTIVEIKNQGRMVICSMDKDKMTPFPYFNHQIEGLCSVNDYIIFTEDKNSKPFILIIELKEKGDPRRQLWAGKQFCDFLINRLNTISRNRKYTPEIRMIGIKSKPIMKAPVRINNIKYNSNNMIILKTGKMNFSDFLK